MAGRKDLMLKMTLMSAVPPPQNSLNAMCLCEFSSRTTLFSTDQSFIVIPMLNNLNFLTYLTCHISSF